MLVPVPEAEAVVGAWRKRYDPVASAGVPAHITLIVPWLPPATIREEDLTALAATLRDVEPFDFELTRTAWFGRRILWVAPSPADRFRALTARLAKQFGTPPWAGEFDEIVPHLTVAHAPRDPAELDLVAADVGRLLPVACRAREVWVMCGDGRRWSPRAKVELIGSAARF